ncbi:MAG TPA: DUF397 domain-containing protein [Micromonosporaceae bacterium]
MSKLDKSWKKSSRSGTGACVEVRLTETGDVQVRDSKDPNGSVLTFTPAEWDAFVTGTKAGDFSF